MRLIIYTCPGHQFSEFVPWLINNSPDVTHGQQWNENSIWTPYESSFGEGWEPAESQWTIADDMLRGTYKKVARDMKSTFPENWFRLFMQKCVDTDVRCIFVNNAPQNIPTWTAQCRLWFAENHPTVDVEFAGHTLDLRGLANPSLYFIKEGYIFDDDGYVYDDHNEEGAVLDYIAKNLTGAPNIKARIKNKHAGRQTELLKMYKYSKFEYVTDTNTIVDNQCLYEHIAEIITPPNNYDDLVADYWSRNKPNDRLDDYLRTLL